MTKASHTAALLLATTLPWGTAAAQEAPDNDVRAPGADDQPVLAAARDALELESTNVTGNRELPRVMVIVPWKRSAPGELAGRPLNSLMDEVLTPIDREVFVRQLKFYDGLRVANETQASDASAGETQASN
ncbi:MAG: hypothetical protein AAFN78_16415 [Pseudomonadota bacterium]